MHLKTQFTATIVPPAEDITDSGETTAVRLSPHAQKFHTNSPENHSSWTKRRKRKLLTLKCVFVYAYHWIPATMICSMNALSYTKINMSHFTNKS